jgi:GNAT superfamily N-acetyltransferase
VQTDSTIRHVDDVSQFRDQILTVYSAVFSQPPYNETAEQITDYAGLFDKVSTRAGFRCVVALAGHRLTGFAYGYRGEPGHSWYDMVGEHLGPEQSERWLSDAFEFVEFAVDPVAQGAGIGSRLHDALLAGLSYRTAVASTPAQDNPALDFYLKRGWKILRADFVFRSSDQPSAIIGLDLQP